MCVVSIFFFVVLVFFILVVLFMESFVNVIDVLFCCLGKSCCDSKG